MRARLPALSCLLTTVALFGCGAPEGRGEGAAFVFFDTAARNAGLALVTGTEVLPAELTPLELDAPQVGALRRLPEGRPLRHGTTPPPAVRLEHLADLELQPDEAVHVRGSNGEVVRGPADADRVYLMGPEKAAQELAARFGAWPTRLDGSEDAAALGRADRWVLVAPDVLSLMASLEPRDLEELDGVMPAFFDGEAADEQEAELGRAADEEEVARNEARAIERDLAVLVTLRGAPAPGQVPMFDVGQEVPLHATLTNASSRARAVVWPGDGSSVGWREPYVRWTVERESAPGTWQELPRAQYSRCGNYDADWQKDVALLEPGDSKQLADMLSPNWSADLTRPGHYRARAHYQYGAGLGRRGVFGLALNDLLGEPPPQARLIDGVPAFEVISEPFEFRIERGLVLELHPRGAELDPASTDSLEVWLVNRSRTPRTIGDGKISLSVDLVDAEPMRQYRPFSLQEVTVQGRVFQPGERMRVPLVADPGYASTPVPNDAPRAGLVTASGWLWQGEGELRTTLNLHGNRVQMSLRRP